MHESATRQCQVAPLAKTRQLSHLPQARFQVTSRLVQATSWCHGVTRYQWLVLFVAWLGWVFDSMDSTIYAMVRCGTLWAVKITGNFAPLSAHAFSQPERSLSANAFASSG